MVSLLAASCGFGQLQTARTTPAGTTLTTAGATVVNSGFVNAREPPSVDPTFVLPFVYVPPHLEVRRGLTDNVDIGGRLTFGIGLTGDVKVNLLPAQWRFALAVAGGAGAAVSLGEQGIYIFHLPATVSASYDITDWLTPYVGARLSRHLDVGRGRSDAPGLQLHGADRSREGLLTPAGGIEIGNLVGFALLVEYGRLIPLWHDPGHGYQFKPADMFSIAIRKGRAAGVPAVATVETPSATVTLSPGAGSSKLCVAVRPAVRDGVRVRRVDGNVDSIGTVRQRVPARARPAGVGT